MSEPLEVLRNMLDRQKKELVACERMIELLKPEWDKFEARTGHNLYVTRDYSDHFSAARKHRKEIEALEAGVNALARVPTEERVA